MSAVLVLVRHGRTTWNGERFLGRADVALDETGRRQAHELVAALRGTAVDTLLVSPLRRARDTAAPLARDRGLHPHVVPELAELDCGTLEGRLKADHGKLAKRDPLLPFPDGESLTMAQARTEPVARRVLDELEVGRTVAVVGHYVVNQLLLGALTGQGAAQSLRQGAYRPRPGSAWRWVPGTAPQPVEVAA